MNSPKLGSIADVCVIRNNGTVEEFGKYHNTLGTIVAIGSPQERVKIPASTVIRCFTGPAILSDTNGYGSSTMTGTYTVSGNTLYGISSSENLINNPNSIGALYEFPSGFKAYKTASITGFSDRCTLSLSSTEIASSIIRHKTSAVGFGNNMNLEGTRPTSSATGVVTYQNLSTSGVYTRELSALFPPTESGYDLYRITYTSNADQSYGGYIDINPPISLSAWDSLLIRNLTYSHTYNVDAPRGFSVSPIAGIVGSGRMQRTIPYTMDEYNSTVTSGEMSRIYMLTDANKIPFLSAMPSTRYNPTLSAKYTIITGTSNQEASLTNNCISRLSAVGSFVSDGSSIKQILYGGTTYISGIIEYDTDVTILSGTRYINLQSMLSMSVDT